MAQPGPGCYGQLFLVDKVTGGWGPVIDLSGTERIHHSDQVQDGDGRISYQVDLLGGLDVLHRPKGCVFPYSDLSGVSTISLFLS